MFSELAIILLVPFLILGQHPVKLTEPCKPKNHPYFVVVYDKSARVCGGFLIRNNLVGVSYFCTTFRLKRGVHRIRAGVRPNFQYRKASIYIECEEQHYCSFMIVRATKPFKLTAYVATAKIPMKEDVKKCTTAVEVYGTWKPPWRNDSDLALFCNKGKIVDCGGKEEPEGNSNDVCVEALKSIVADDYEDDNGSPRDEWSKRGCMEHSGGALLCNGYLYGFFDGYKCKNTEERPPPPKAPLKWISEYSNVVHNLRHMAARMETNVREGSTVENKSRGSEHSWWKCVLVKISVAILAWLVL